MEFINFLRRLIALPFRIVALVVLLAGVILAVPFLLIAGVFGPRTDDFTNATAKLLERLGMINKLYGEDDDGEDDNDFHQPESIAF